MYQHLLHEETIKTGLQAETKEDGFKQLIELLPEWQFSTRKKKKLLELLLVRESYVTTAIGDRVALPHAIIEDLDVPVAVLGISKEGISFNSLDGEPVHYIYLALFPQTDDNNPIKKEVLLGAQKALSDSYIQALLISSKDSHTALQILRADLVPALYEAGVL